MRLKKFNQEVFFAEDSFIKISSQDINFLKNKAEINGRKRARLCAHKGIKDKLHEMFIVHTKDAYVRPHKHLNKSESLYVIEGAAKIFIFDEKSNIIEAIQLGDCKSKNRFYYRISKPIYHSLIITTDFFIFHEVTSGPFKKSDTVFPLWAPDENDINGVKEFMNRLSKYGRQ